MGEPEDYAVGYGRPPLETRFQKGQSGNPGGRPRESKTLAALLAEALSRRSGFANADGSWMTQAEAIFVTLVGQAAGPDLKAKRLLFDILVKLQRANICWPQDRLPEIQCGDSEENAAGAQVAAEIDRLALRMQRDRSAQGPVAHGPAAHGPGAHGPAAHAPPVEAPPGEGADPIAPPSTI